MVDTHLQNIMLINQLTGCNDLVKRDREKITTKVLSLAAGNSQRKPVQDFGSKLDL